MNPRSKPNATGRRKTCYIHLGNTVCSNTQFPLERTRYGSSPYQGLKISLLPRKMLPVSAHIYPHTVAEEKKFHILYWKSIKDRKMATLLNEITAAGSFLLKGNTATTKLFYTVWMQFASYFPHSKAQPSPRYFVPVWPGADEKLHPQTFQLGCPWGKVEQMRTRARGHDKVPHLNRGISFPLASRVSHF